MAVLQKMSDILNNNETSEPLANIKMKKTVTFRDPIPEPRVGRRAGDLQQSPKTLLSPRVIGNDRKMAKAVVDRPLRIASSAGPTPLAQSTPRPWQTLSAGVGQNVANHHST